MRDFILAVFIVFDILTFFLYVIDKLKAMGGRWRIPERVLLLCTLPGGIGAALGMLLARHKIRKPLFLIICTLSCIGQAAYVLQGAMLC